MMKVYFTIFCLLFVLSASSQMNQWKAFESPANGKNSCISQLGNKLIVTRIDSIANSSTKAAVFTYIWDGVKWDSLPYLALENQGVPFPYKPIFYKNKICYCISGNGLLVNGQYLHLVTWQDSSWEEIPFKYYDTSAYMQAFADSMGLYVTQDRSSGSWTNIKYYKYNDTDWTSYNQQQYDLLGWPQDLVYKGQLLITETQNIGGQTIKYIILKFDGSKMDTILYGGTYTANLLSINNELLLFNDGIYRFDSNAFKKTDDSSIPEGYSINSKELFFVYNNNVIGYAYDNNNSSQMGIRYDGHKWYVQHIFFDSIQLYLGTWSYGNKMIAIAYDSVFKLSGKSSQCLGYLDSLEIFKGKVYNDLDTNCIFSNADADLKGQYLYCNELGYIYSDKDGSFEDMVSQGQYTFKPIKSSSRDRYGKTSICFPDSIIINVADSSKNTIYEFPIQRSANIPDLAVYLTANLGTRARRGFDESYTISCRNWGTLKQSALLYIYYPPHLSNLNFSLPPDTINNNYVSWLIDSMKTDSQMHIKIDATFDTTYFHDSDLIYFYAKILPENNDSYIYDNRDTIKQYIVSSWDPNFKCAMPGDIDGNAVIQPGVKQLNYTIHFENTGTDTAYNIKVVDVLDSAINPFSIYTTASSDECNMSVYKNTVTWQFNNIKLSPQDNANPDNHLSEGFVSYRVNLKNDFPIGTRINNTADIYFDYNAPVQTNTSVVLINQTTSPSYVRLPAEYNTFEVYPNPANDKLYISAENLKTIYIYNLLGELVYQSNFVLSKSIDISALGKGLYLLKAENTFGEKHVIKFVKE